ncbi:sulfatase [Pseudopedobacter saltans DSM 12145]|uniref:Sulfatase n=1 Tax=Pseudopedobacter saltans (strain ATCC 51119 / DSM 12145 / JCM 21818 / CCUG 39354 / LMG 10337 / NBRC 100064 / NCIMB 13643) TaxID=762903 RepID=F0SAI7_PSESL|nr:arylsulfatase [Pseudopedobacter saltans]ADY52607.1 sulfatase [Pseudopedobacter saltans DSM 12145]
MYTAKKLQRILLLTLLGNSFYLLKVAAQTLPKPNIVYILTDDLGYGDISILNKESKIHTTHIDNLAKNGIYFTDAHSNSSVCTPTRYGILTGRYAFRSSLKKGVLNGYSPSLIEPERATIASFLRKNGYTTACIGKWHLGLDFTKKDPSKAIGGKSITESPQNDDDNVDYTKAIKGGPTDHGFDYSYIIPASLDMNPYVYIRNGKAVKEPTSYTTGKSENQERGSMRRPGKMAPDFNFQEVLPNFINDAVNYIQSSTQKPFFLYLPLPSPHTPWVPSKEFKNVSGAGNYGDYVAETDYMIGKVLKALKDKGLDKNTLVIVTSDNGSDWKPEDIEATNHYANYIYRGRKADIYESGHRIPFIASWPSKIPMGTMSNQIMCTTDLFATVAAIVNQPLPQDAAEDSYNMLDAFTGKNKTKQIREAIIHHSLGGIFAIRKGDWKLTTALGSGGFTQPRTLEPQANEAPMTLYNIANDPQEKNNLYNSQPKIVKELMTLLTTYKQQGYSRPKK